MKNFVILPGFFTEYHPGQKVRGLDLNRAVRDVLRDCGYPCFKCNESCIEPDICDLIQSCLPTGGGTGGFTPTDLPTDYGVTLAPVATSGNYTDLVGLPILNQVGGDVTGSIDLSTGSFTLTGPNGIFGAGNEGGTAAINNYSLATGGLNIDGSEQNYDLVNTNTAEIISGNSTTNAVSGLKTNRFLGNAALPLGVTLTYGGSTAAPAGGVGLYHTSNVTGESSVLVLDTDNNTILGGSPDSNLVLATRKLVNNTAIPGSFLQLGPGSDVEYSDFSLPTTVTAGQVFVATSPTQISAVSASVSSTGAPTGVVTPDYAGQQYVDITTPGSPIIWTSIGTANTDWVQIS